MQSGFNSKEYRTKFLHIREKTIESIANSPDNDSLGSSQELSIWPRCIVSAEIKIFRAFSYYNISFEHIHVQIESFLLFFSLLHSIFCFALYSVPFFLLHLHQLFAVFSLEVAFFQFRWNKINIWNDFHFYGQHKRERIFSSGMIRNRYFSFEWTKEKKQNTHTRKKKLFTV